MYQHAVSTIWIRTSLRHDWIYIRVLAAAEDSSQSFLMTTHTIQAGDRNGSHDHSLNKASHLQCIKE
jgi:hypothetical protein